MHMYVHILNIIMFLLISKRKIYSINISAEYTMFVFVRLAERAFLDTLKEDIFGLCLVGPQV